MSSAPDDNKLARLEEELESSREEAEGLKVEKRELLAAQRVLKTSEQSLDKNLKLANANAAGQERRADQLDKRVKELEAIVKAHKTGQPPVVVATKDPGDGTPENGGEKPVEPAKGHAKPVSSGNYIAEAIPGVPGSFFAKLPNLLDEWSPKTKAVTVPLVSAPGGLSVKIIPVIKKAPGQPFWSTEEAGAVTIHYEKTDAMAITTQHTVGKAEVKDGKLLWQWQEFTFGQSSKLRAELQSIYDVTRNSVLQVVDANEKVTQVQLVSPERAAIKVGQSRKLRALPRGSKPRLILVGAPGWHLKEDRSGRRIESRNGVRIDLDLLEKKNQVELKTGWGRDSTLAYIDAELGKAKTQLLSLEKDGGKKRAYLTDMQKKSREKEQEIEELGGQIIKFSKESGISELNGKIEKAQSRLKSLAKYIRYRTQDINENPKNKVELITKRTKLEKEQEALQKEVNGLKGDLYKVHAQKLPGTEKTLRQAQQELGRLKAEQYKLEKQVSVLRRSLYPAEKKLADAKRNKARLEAQKKDIAALTSLQLNALTQRSDAILGIIVITK